MEPWPFREHPRSDGDLQSNGGDGSSWDLYLYPDEDPGSAVADLDTTPNLFDVNVTYDFRDRFTFPDLQLSFMLMEGDWNSDR